MTEAIRCTHRHGVDEHPACFAQGEVLPTKTPWYKEDGMKIGYLDIESDGLQANHATMLTWCLKEKDGPTYFDVNSKADLFGGLEDRRIVASLLHELKNYRIIVTYYGCVTPGHKVLKSDLNWEQVENLKPGDTLLAFDEEAKPDRRTRQYTKSTVINNIPMVKKVSTIKLSDGKTLIATDDHPWLVQLGGGRRGDKTGYWVWRTTKQLKENLSFPQNPVYMTKMLDVWDKDNSYESGYLAGFFDGEGSVSYGERKGRQGNHFSLHVSATQNVELNRSIVERIVDYIDKLGFETSPKVRTDRNGAQLGLEILGGLSERLKFIGITNLCKKEKLNIEKLGRITNLGKIQIESIVDSGDQVVCGLETSSKTYIVDGYGSHNTGFDVPYVRTKALHYGMEFPSYAQLYHFDMYYCVKSKLSLSSKSLDSACAYLNIPGKSHLDWEIWMAAKYGDPVALREVLSHNIGDVDILEQLHNKLTPFQKWTRRSV